MSASESFLPVSDTAGIPTTTMSRGNPALTVPAASDAPAAAAPLTKPVPKLPPGYKLVKVRMPNGYIKTVKRKIVPAEAAPSVTAAATSSAGPGEPAAREQPEVVEQAASTTAAPAVAASVPAGTVPKPHTSPAVATLPKEATVPISSASAASKTIPAATIKSLKPVAAAQRSTPAQPVAGTTPQASAGPQPIKSPSRRFFGAFAARAAVAFAPDFIDDFHDGDELVDDGHDSDDSWDDNGEDDQIDQHDYGNGKSNSGTHNYTSNTSAVIKGLTALPPAYAAQAGQRSAVPTAGTLKDVHVEQKSGKPAAAVNEKEVDLAGNSTPDTPAPKDLSKRFLDWTRYVMYAVMIILPIIFIVLGVLTAELNGKTYGTSFGNNVTQFIKVAVSAWPIIFAAVVAQSLRAYATYKVERGINLMHLEQLMSSNSVAGSVKQPFMLRRFNAITIALLCLWGLSPLASQAMLRMSYQSTSTNVTETSIYYLDTTTTNPVLRYNASDFKSINFGNIMFQLYQASLLPPGPYQEDYADNWGNPKVPIISALYEDDYDSITGWWEPAYFQNYSSNFGVLLAKFPSTKIGIANLTVSTSYLDVKCPIWDVVLGTQLNATGLNLITEPDLDNYMAMVPQTNTSTPGRLAWAAVIYGPDPTDANGNLLNNPATGLPYTSKLEYTYYSYGECTFNQTFVDVNLHCDVSVGNSDCFVQRIKLSEPQPQLIEMADFSNQFLNASGAFTDRYIYDPLNETAFFFQAPYQNLSVVPQWKFQALMGICFNSYWQIGFAPTVAAVGFDYISATTSYFRYSVGNASVTTLGSHDIYATSWAWLGTLLGCSVILLVAGVASIIWDIHTIVPDILGFASSVARRSKYVDLPKVDSSTSGPERARLLAHQTVMMQDVKPDAPVGRIALGTAHNKAVRLKTGRMYR